MLFFFFSRVCFLSNRVLFSSQSFFAMYCASPQNFRERELSSWQQKKISLKALFFFPVPQSSDTSEVKQVFDTGVISTFDDWSEMLMSHAEKVVYWAPRCFFPSAETLGEAFSAKAANVLTNASGSKCGRLGDFFRTLHASTRNTFVRIKTKVISCIASDSIKYTQ